MSLVLLSRDGPVATIRLNRAEKRNAVDDAMAQAMRSALQEIEADPAIRVSILTGEGRVFCAGMDLAAFAAGERPGIWHPDAFAGCTAFPRSKPMIAAVQGAALAGGFEVMLACDMVIAAEGTVFGLPEVTMGLIAGGGGCFRLPRRVPRVVAMEMILGGGTIDASRALQLGLVNRVVPASDLLQAANELADRIAANAPQAVRYAFALAQMAADEGEEALWSRSNRHWAALDGTAEAREGVSAFREKRAPQWPAREA